MSCRPLTHGGARQRACGLAPPCISGARPLGDIKRPDLEVRSFHRARQDDIGRLVQCRPDAGVTNLWDAAATIDLPRLIVLWRQAKMGFNVTRRSKPFRWSTASKVRFTCRLDEMRRGLAATVITSAPPSVLRMTALTALAFSVMTSSRLSNINRVRQTGCLSHPLFWFDEHTETHLLWFDGLEHDYIASRGDDFVIWN